MHIKPNDLTNNVFLRVKGWREMVLTLFFEADSDAMPHFKQTMFPFVNLANQQTDVGCRMANLQPTSF